jgi:predicted ATP-grasp superfamily ATP-dependent carboligase
VRLFVYECLSAGGLGADAPTSLRREGRAMLCAAIADFGCVPGMQVSTVLDQGFGEVRGCECRRVAVGKEPDAFRDFAAYADATLVIAPEFDDVLRQRSDWVLEVGGRLLGSCPEAISTVSDKLALFQFWQRQNVRTPATAHAIPTPPRGFGPPWVCKPRQGAGAQATFLVDDATAWPAAFATARAEWPAGDLLVQQFIPGTAASVAFLVGPGQCVPLMPATQSLSVDGRFHYLGGQTLPVPLRDRAVRLARCAIAGIGGLQGYVGVDLVLGAAKDGSEDHAIEINPRLTTSYLGSRELCRDNLAAAWLDVLQGDSVKLAWRDGIVAFHADGSVA